VAGLAGPPHRLTSRLCSSMRCSPEGRKDMYPFLSRTARWRTQAACPGWESVECGLLPWYPRQPASPYCSLLTLRNCWAAGAMRRPGGVLKACFWRFVDEAAVSGAWSCGVSQGRTRFGLKYTQPKERCSETFVSSGLGDSSAPGLPLQRRSPLMLEVSECPKSRFPP
jgi:hypothetical protein